MNLEGYCQNEDCKAYKDLVIDPVGHGSFSLTADKVTSDCRLKACLEGTVQYDCMHVSDGRLNIPKALRRISSL